jgi:predicted porin
MAAAEAAAVPATAAAAAAAVTVICADHVMQKFKVANQIIGKALPTFSDQSDSWKGVADSRDFQITP